MNKTDIVALLKKSGYINDKAATMIGQYSDNMDAGSLTTSSVTNRSNSGWGRAEYVVLDHGTGTFNLAKALNGWKLLARKYKNQYLILEVSTGNWKVYDYDGNELGGNEYIEKMFENRHTTEDSLQKIFFGCPGTGKSYHVNKLIKSSIYSDETTFRKYLELQGKVGTATIDKYIDVLKTKWVCNIAIKNGNIISTLYEINDPEEIEKIMNDEEFITHDSKGKGMYSSALKYYLKYITPFRTTFHPDTDYASFVGCYKPSTKADGSITYTFCPQVFTDAYVAAWKNPGQKIYLVIEEINRGNCAQIFGDIFQLLDRRNGYSEYPIKADNDLAYYLEKQLGEGADGIANRQLCLPPNLIIYATMNTSDQSLFPMDSAFKRRWDWEYIPIDTDCKKSDFVITIGDKKYKWSDFIAKVNQEILTLSESEDKQLGNFFIKGDISIKEFKSKVMFYLWSEICKDYYRSGSFFKYKESEDKVVEFTFNMLFNSSTDVLILQGFMEYLGVPEKKDGTGTTETTTETSTETTTETTAV